MKILVDLTAIDSLDWGVSIYATRLLKGFEQNGIREISLLIKKEMYQVIKEKFPNFNIIILPVTSIQWFRRVHLLGIVNCWMWKQTVEKSDCNIYYSPVPSIFHFWKIKKIRVQTIHDLQGLKVYTGKQKLLQHLLTPLLLYNSDAIISISEYVKHDILKTYRFISKSKIHVVYNSVIVHPEKIDSFSVKVGGPFILYVNSLMEYKNIATLIEAFYLVKDDISHFLLIIGKPTAYWQNTIIPLIEHYGLGERIIHLWDVSDANLAWYYKNTNLFITTSLLEGFGYTPIEAAIYKVPVISTKETALYETTMGAVNYYEPAKSANSLRNKILEVLKTPPTQVELEQISNKMKFKYDYIKQAEEIYNYIISTYRTVTLKSR